MSDKGRMVTTQEANDIIVFEQACFAFIKAYNELAGIVHRDNVAKGFWPDGNKRNIGEALMLVVTELAEGLEGYRKNQKDDHLPQFDSLPVEMADALIRLMDLGHGLMLPVAEALVCKLEYNRSRPFMHGKKF